MRRFALISLFIMTLAASAVPAHALEPRRSGQESFISRAVFADEKLWLLSDAGVLSTIAPGANQRTDISIPSPALDLISRNGEPSIVICDTSACENWELERWTKGQWVIDAKILSQGDRFVAVGSADGGITMLTSRRLIDVHGNSETTTLLASPLRRAPVASLLFTHDQVFVGFDAGEWGGGLQRVDKTTGNVVGVESNEPAGSTRWLLNSDMDPVNGLALEPWHPDCIIAAVGLIHFAPSGRILEICGTRIRRVYFKPFCTPRPSNVPKDFEQFPTPFCGEDGQKAAAGNNYPFSTVAFFGLVSKGDQVWAIGMDGLYQFSRAGEPEFQSLPQFISAGGIEVSFELPHFVLVLTDINTRRSISGSVPMLVPR